MVVIYYIIISLLYGRGGNSDAVKSNIAQRHSSAAINLVYIYIYSAHYSSEPYIAIYANIHQMARVFFFFFVTRPS